MPYPVTFKADYVEKRSRLTTFFRLLLAIPHFIAVTFYFLAAEVVVIIAWFALLFTGRYPQGMYDFVAGALRYQTRVYGYAALLTDQYPPFSGDPGDAVPGRPGHRAAEGGVQPPEGPLPDHPRDPGAHHPLRDADRGPGRRASSRGSRSWSSGASRRACRT